MHVWQLIWKTNDCLSNEVCETECLHQSNFPLLLNLNSAVVLKLNHVAENLTSINGLIIVCCILYVQLKYLKFFFPELKKGET